MVSYGKTAAKHAPLNPEAYLPGERRFSCPGKESIITLSFEQAHREWVDDHMRRRRSERKRRLQEGYGHVETEMLRHIWWPAFGHFHHLHPEYEVTDFWGGPRYLDFAYVRPPVRVAIEVDGFGPHIRDLSRRQFCDQWVRRMHLINDNWIVVRIGYDDVRERPRLWRQLLQQLMGRLFGDPKNQMRIPDCEEREVIRLAMRLGRPLKRQDVETLLQCGYRHARDVMRRLTEKDWFVPAAGGSERVHAWRLNAENKHLPL